jgi:Holliday junction DNA helicase RuvA
MIGRLRGVLLEKRAPDVLIDANGVGYELQAPLGTVMRLPAPGQEVLLHTHLSIREDAHQLFGFGSREERDLFRSLVRVSGVGPKMALAILSGMEADDFVLCVQRNDTAALVRIPGVGKKTAERLIVEMRDRLREWRPELAGARPAAPGPDVVAVSRSRMIQDAESALIALGYKPQEAARAVAAAEGAGGDSSEELIRLALKGMGAGK